MTTTLSDEQGAFKSIAERFAREKLAPHYQTRERAAAVDRALMREMGQLGLIGATSRSVTAGSACRARRSAS